MINTSNASAITNYIAVVNTIGVAASKCSPTAATVITLVPEHSVAATTLSVAIASPDIAPPSKALPKVHNTRRASSTATTATANHISAATTKCCPPAATAVTSDHEHNVVAATLSIATATANISVACSPTPVKNPTVRRPITKKRLSSKAKKPSIAVTPSTGNVTQNAPFGNKLSDLTHAQLL